jgi:nucleoside phosphorylase
MVFTTSKGKISEGGFKPESEEVKLNIEFIPIINAHKKDIIREIMDSDSTRDYGRYNLQAHIQPMACTEAVIDKPGHFVEFTDRDRKTIAVDMESFSILKACESLHTYQTKGIIIKSVMDRTSDKNDGTKAYASYTSAMFLKGILEYLEY